MTIIIAIILGIIQGLTEFLPVSSSGHLVLVQQIFNLNENQILFDVILHLGTLVAVLFVFKNSVWELIKKPFSKKGKMLILTTVITLAIAFLFKDFFEEAFGGSLLAFSFLVTATFLLMAQIIAKKYKNTKKLNYQNTAVMGLFQAMAIMPGISRAGATISSAVVQGVNKEDAAEFSFLMSVPIILASLMWEVLKLGEQPLNLEVVPTVFGFIFAAVFGVVAIKLMLVVIRKAKYHYFSIYLVALSLFILLNQFVLGWF